MLRESVCFVSEKGLMIRTTALRELHEETGYGSGKAGEGNASVGRVSSILVKDPGRAALRDLPRGRG